MKTGFIQIIIILVLLLIILSLLGVSLTSLFSNPILKDNFGFVTKGAYYVWDNYLGAPVKYIWGVFRDLIWNQFLNVMNGIKNNINPFDSIAPQQPPPSP